MAKVILVRIGSIDASRGDLISGSGSGSDYPYFTDITTIKKRDFVVIPGGRSHTGDQVHRHQRIFQEIGKSSARNGSSK